MRRCIPCMLCVFLLSFVSPLAHAATYYVRQATGLDTNLCTAGDPGQARQTINAGVACLASGDTLLVGPGTYDEVIGDVQVSGSPYPVVPIPSGGGSWATATTVRAESPGTTTLLLVTPPGGTGIIEIDTNSWIVIDGFILDGQFQVDFCIGMVGHHHRYANLEIKNCVAHGFLGGGDDHEFVNLYMHHIGWNYAGQNICPSTICENPPGEVCTDRCHALYLCSPGSPCSRAFLDGGRFHDIESHAVHWYIDNGTVRNAYIKDVGAGIVIYGNPLNSHVYNNVVINTRKASIGFAGGGSTTTMVHNTICKNIDSDYTVSQATGRDNLPATMKNNLVIQSPVNSLRSYLYVQGGVGPSGNLLADSAFPQVAGNLCDNTTMVGCSFIAASPSPVVNCATGDVHLIAGSSAIGQSPSLGATYALDRDNNPRPTSGNVDTGAYVFATGGGPVATALQFLTQPGTTVVGSVITPAITVRVIDQFGALFPGGSSVVTLTLGTNPTGAQLLGTPQVSTVSGVATFSNIQVTMVGNGYQLHASNPSLTEVMSNAFDILPPATPGTSAHLSPGHFLMR